MYYKLIYEIKDFVFRIKIIFFHLDAKYYFLKDLYTEYTLKTVLHT